jgi:tetratricopeptide (TPR) repeat protein
MSDITDTQPNQPQAGPVQKTAKVSPLLLAILGFLALIALGIMGGYFSGQSSRLQAQSTQISQQILEQFNLGNQAMEAGQYDVARAHFQFVIDHNPDFPGVKDAYAQLLLRMQITPTPADTPTPLATATLDPGGAEAIYNHIHGLIAAGPKTIDDWDAVITQLDSLRKADLTYHAAEVDGLYYLSLRQRGVAEIFAQPCQDINLEGGIYDLTLASNFGPLDGYTDALRTYSRLYISGSTFWEIDWKQAQGYFAQVMDALPNLMDSSCLTSTRRWVQATIKVADQLLASGDVCGASDQYAAAAAVDAPENATAQPTASYADKKCHPPKPKPQASVTPGGETPTEPPTATTP